MRPDQLRQELPDWLRLIVWDRKEKYKIQGCCFGFEVHETPCFIPSLPDQPQGLVYFPLPFMISLYIAIGIFKI